MMEIAPQYNSHAHLAMCALAVVVLTGCGGSGGGDDINSADTIHLDVSEQASGNASIALDPGTPEFTPSPGNGLPISYEDPGVGQQSIDEFIGAQWEHMQTCLQVSAQEPVVIVTDGELKPTDSNDDVVRHIDGRIQASAHVTDTSASIHVRAGDFDGSVGEPGSYLRSIMGRYLWLANNLEERHYPYNCAKG